jgi:hypothetical protein
MLKTSVIAKTGQIWKFIVALLALVAGSVVPIFPAVGLSWTAGTVMAIAGYVFGVALIRCPACGSRWFWKALMDPEIYKAVFVNPVCPDCGK